VQVLYIEMSVDNYLTNASIVSFFLVNVALLYLDNTELIGFALFFVWNFLENVFLFQNFSLTTLEMGVLFTIGVLLLVSMYLVILSLWKLHNYYIAKSESIKHFPERRKALDNYKAIYIVSQVLFMFLFFLRLVQPNNTAMMNWDTTFLLGGLVLFLSVWFGIQGRETDLKAPMTGVVCGLAIMMGGMFGFSQYFPKLYTFQWKTGLYMVGISMSSYLVYLANWIHVHSMHSID
jgi:hypothetical protein